MGSKSQANPRLVVIEGKDKGKVVSLKDGTLVIGRTKGDVIVQDARASRSHVSITFDEKSGKVTFSDLKSLNGTQLNGNSIAMGDLNDGDKLQVGNTTFDCQIGPPTESSEISFALPEDAPKTDSQHRQEPELAPLEAPDEDEKSAKKQKKKKKKRAEPAAELPDEVEDLFADEPPAEAASEKPAKKEKKAKEPKAPKAPKEKISKKERLSMIKAAYLRMPAKARNAGLLGTLLLALFIAFGKSTKRGGGGGAALERDMASVRKLLSQGKVTEAVAKATELKAQYGESSQVHMTLGDLYTQQGKNDLALQSYLKAHDLKPPQPLVHTRILASYLRAGVQQDALAELEHIEAQIKSDPPKEVISEVAQLFLDFKELKQPPEKTLILARALQNDKAPDSTVGYRLEAQTLFQMNRPQDAIGVMEKGLKIDPTDDWLLENIVFARLAIKDIPGAATMAENWIRLKPKATKAMLVMAYLKYNAKAYNDSLPYLQKIVDVAAGQTGEPHHPEALNLMGQIYQQLNQRDQAIVFYKKACEADFKQACDNELLKTAGTTEAPPAGSSAPAPASIPGTSPEVVTPPAAAPAAPPADTAPRSAPAPIKGAGAPSP